MPLPIGFGDLWKIFELANGKKAANRQKVEEWLDAVYSDLDDLSKLWVAIISGSESDDGAQSKEAIVILYSRGRLNLNRQQIIAGRLLEFYNSASLIVGEQKFKDAFIFRLGSLLAARLEARKIVDNDPAVRLARVPRETEPTLTMEEAFTKLQDELVGLQVLIRNFKAQP